MSRLAPQATTPPAALVAASSLSSPPTPSLVATSSWGECYFTVFLENNFGIFNSNRIAAASRGSSSTIGSNNPVSELDVVAQMKMHQLAFGVAFGSIIDGTIDGTHGPAFQCCLESLPATTPADGSTPSVRYRVTYTAGFAVNTAFSRDTMSSKQVAVGLVFVIRNAMLLQTMLSHPYWPRQLLNVALDAGVRVTMDFFRGHMSGEVVKQMVSKLTDHEPSVRAYQQICEGVHTMVRLSTCPARFPWLTARSLHPAAARRVACLAAPPATMLPRSSLADFEYVVEAQQEFRRRRESGGVGGLTSRPSPMSTPSKAVSGQPTPSFTANDPPDPPSVIASLADAGLCFSQAIAQLCSYNEDFLASVIAGTLGVSSFRSAVAGEGFPPIGGAGDGAYDDFWTVAADMEQYETNLRAMRIGAGASASHSRRSDDAATSGDDFDAAAAGLFGSATPSMRSMTPPCEPHMQPHHVKPLSYQSGAAWMYDGAAGDAAPSARQPDERTPSPSATTIPKKTFLGPPSQRQNPSAGAQSRSAPPDGSHLLSQSQSGTPPDQASGMWTNVAKKSTSLRPDESMALRKRVPPKIVMFTTDAALARNLMCVVAFFYRRTECHEYDESMDYVETVATFVHDYFLNQNLKAASSADAEGPTISHGELLARLAVCPVTAAAPAGGGPFWVPKDESASSVSRELKPCSVAELIQCPIVWVPEEYQPKVHLDMLMENQRLSLETTLLIIAPRCSMVRRLDFHKKYSPRHILVEKRISGDVTCTFPFQESDRCFTARVVRDEVVLPCQFWKLAVKRSLAAANVRQSSGVVPVAVSLEEVIEVTHQHARLYQQLAAASDGQSSWSKVEHLVASRGSSAFSGGSVTQRNQTVPSTSAALQQQQRTTPLTSFNGKLPAGRNLLTSQDETVRQTNWWLQDMYGSSDVDLAYLQLLHLVTGV